ncbi:hypothetical protein D1872_297260 [compost metagenome]
MDKWQDQQLTIRELKATAKPVEDPNKIDRKQLEDIVKQLEYSVRQLKLRARPEQNLFPE